MKPMQDERLYLFYSRWGCIFSISIFDWNYIRFFKGWDFIKDWGCIQVDTVRPGRNMIVFNLSIFQQNTIQEKSAVPRMSYTKSLFREFMSKLTSRGLLRRIPFRHIKIVFFNLLTAIGSSIDERTNKVSRSLS